MIRFYFHPTPNPAKNVVPGCHATRFFGAPATKASMLSIN